MPTFCVQCKEEIVGLAKNGIKASVSPFSPQTTVPGSTRCIVIPACHIGTQVLGNPWHRTCFVCAYCNKALPEQYAIFENRPKVWSGCPVRPCQALPHAVVVWALPRPSPSPLPYPVPSPASFSHEPYHNECWEIVAALKCTKCGQEVDSDDGVQVHGANFHVSCFRSASDLCPHISSCPCRQAMLGNSQGAQGAGTGASATSASASATCGTYGSLLQVQQARVSLKRTIARDYDFLEGDPLKPYHTRCYNKSMLPKCASCQQQIHERDPGLRVAGDVHHSKCYKCQACQGQLGLP
eukprot:gene3112-605_t